MATPDEILAEAKAKFLGNPATSMVSADLALANAKRRHELKSGSTSSNLASAGRGFANDFFRTTMNIPNAAAIAATKMRGDIPRTAGENLGQQFSTMPDLNRQSYDFSDQLLPPSFSPQDFFAAAQLTGEGLAALTTGTGSEFTPFSEAANQQALITERAQAENPISFGVGQGLAQGALLAGGRSRFSRDRALFEIRNAPVVQRIAAKTTTNPATSLMDELKYIAKGMEKTVTKSSLSKYIATRGLRAGEAGVEGYLLSMVNGEQSPEDTAAFSAGLQATGSLALSGLASVTGGGAVPATVKLLGALAATTAAIQLFKSATPGGDDYILPSTESAFNKVAMTMALGTMFGIAGYGRYTGKTLFSAESLPALADAMTSVPRGAIVSTINGIKSDPRAERVINRMLSDPGYFGSAAARRVERALTNSDVSIVETIDSLMDSREFRTKFNEMD